MKWIRLVNDIYMRHAQKCGRKASQKKKSLLLPMLRCIFLPFVGVLTQFCSFIAILFILWCMESCKTIQSAHSHIYHDRNRIIPSRATGAETFRWLLVLLLLFHKIAAGLCNRIIDSGDKSKLIAFNFAINIFCFIVFLLLINNIEKVHKRCTKRIQCSQQRHRYKCGKNNLYNEISVQYQYFPPVTGAITELR